MKRAIMLLAMLAASGAALAQDEVQPPTVTLTILTGKNTATVSWTAPGDACTNATVAEYDVRFSGSAITECNFTSATQFSTIPSPTSPGGSDCAGVSGLGCSTLYYVGWKCRDSAGNWSDLVTGTMTTKNCGTSTQVFCP